MTIETLVSALKQNTDSLPGVMKLETDSIIINQCDADSYRETEYEGHRICIYDMNERGVGASRNSALSKATADIILFSDEDIVYEPGYAKRIIEEFEKRPDADMLLFNVDVIPERRTYYIEEETKVGLLNCGRYPAYSFACKREELIKRGIRYSLLFGGGAKYSNGEDSLFIQECIKKGMKIYALPIRIGEEVARPSTWFNGYTDKFFFDRGVLYAYMYGILSFPMALRFVIKMRNMASNEHSFSKALGLMLKGMKEGRESKKAEKQKG
jgi:glycosyltransferase involved in cell wall biosynthesis